MNKRVLVTGAHGFIGRHTLSDLVARDYEVHATTRAEVLPGGGGVTWHHSDVLDVPETTDLVGSVAPTHLLHLAWCTEPGEYWTSSVNVRWAEASIALLRAFAEAGGRRAVFAGSCAEYELGEGPCSETTTPCRPRTLYGACKHAVDAVWCGAAPALDLSAAAGRIFNVYGPAEHPSRLVASVARALLRNEPADCSAGAQLRDFLHSADVAAALVHLLESDIAGGVNVASGSAVTVRAVVEKLGQLVDRPGLIRMGSRPAGVDEPPRIIADIARITEDGWRPLFTLETGLADTVDWWRRELAVAGPRSPR